jgi:SAM-dependent methyltransferase
MKREFDPDQPEQMDRPQPVSPALEEDLRNLVSLNRLFGSHRLVRHFLSRWFNPGRSYRVLDLATGAGDLPRVMVDWARPREIALRIDAVDANPATLEIARRDSLDYREIEFLNADVLTYEGRESYDLVCCSLALHHFSENDAATLLGRCRALSHRFVLVADLERSLFTLLGVQALTSLFYRAPMTRADGVTSARRAFSFDEFRALAEAASWKDFGHARFLFCRQALWMEGRDAGDIPVAVETEDNGLPCPT